jgi:decaprenyl-phosphate phosphoribosyltransferase
MSIATPATPQVARRRPGHPAAGFDPSALPPHLRLYPEDQGTTLSAAQVWLRQLRCRQWPKNLVVLAAPTAAAALGHTFVAGRAALALVVVCLLSSAAYLVNDLFDLEEDRRHPVKCHRPVASGAITAPEALIAAAGCLLVALVTAAMVDVQLLLLALAYTGVNLAYSGWARAVPVLDIAAVAVLVLLRTLAGGAATGLSTSPWLIAAITLAAFLVAADQRYAQIHDPTARRSRPVLRNYRAGLLRRIGLVACAGTVLTYALWVLSAGAAGTPALRDVSLVPFAVAVLRYGQMAAQGGGEAPARLFSVDRPLQLAAAVWLLLFLAGA